ncbi:prenyltransferase/squalene oxidase repeat-containing protein [Streptomyces hoynatensis]|uniref:Squalene cyclase C-terminal domain-containing protein n=1 Tax=Streptomyces hoynatensis TaxID=1141874 RepID=A0A3A9ZBN1_9ACTN|nr:prenyltransferase/squalene oxidase repeat-containing protein [Streptomyces hoynatensis]RKN45852.1 hypothetical protein D7294_05270 [Streptomyces hoynatensis]
MSPLPRRSGRPLPPLPGRPRPGRTRSGRTAPGSRAALGALAGGLALLTGSFAAPAAQAAAPAQSPAGARAAEASPGPAASELPEGLFGRGDPQFDGVFRQSIALLAQHAAGFTPAPEAVDWLLAQQCADGSFLSYRADTAQPCADVTAADSNATAMAVQALVALGGHEDAAGEALTWLAGVQNEDGGWSYNPGGASDANSTAVVVGAFVSAGRDPAEVLREEHSPYDALASFQLGCDAADGDRGAFAWQPDEESGALFANDAATVDAILASYGSGLLVDPDAAPSAVPPTGLDCGTGGDGQATNGTGDASSDAPGDSGAGTGEETEDAGGSGDAGVAGASGAEDQAGGEEQVPAHVTSAAAGAAQLADRLAEGGGHLVSALPGAGEGTAGGEPAEQPDFNSTAKAVIALAAGGNEEAWQGPLQWLIENHASWADYAANPSAVGVLVLAAHATGVSPGDFGGTDLLAQLNALGPAPDGGAANGDAAGGDGEGDGEGLAILLWVVGVGLVVGIGIGGLLSTRRKRKAS